MFWIRAEPIRNTACLINDDQLLYQNVGFLHHQVKKLGKKDTMPRGKDESKDFEQ